MNSKQKEHYSPPSIEVIEMQAEGSVMSASLTGVPDGGSATQSYQAGRSRNHYNAASSSELEDIINDILTIEQ